MVKCGLYSGFVNFSPLSFYLEKLHSPPQNISPGRWRSGNPKRNHTLPYTISSHIHVLEWCARSGL